MKIGDPAETWEGNARHASGSDPVVASFVVRSSHLVPMGRSGTWRSHSREDEGSEGQNED